MDFWVRRYSDVMDGLVKIEDGVIGDQKVLCRWCGIPFDIATGPIRSYRKSRNKECTLRFCSRECYNEHHREYMKNRPRYNAWLQIRKRAKAAGFHQPSYEEYLAGVQSGDYDTMDCEDYHRRMAYRRSRRRTLRDYLDLIARLEEYREREGVWPDTKTVIDMYVCEGSDRPMESIRQSVTRRMDRMEGWDYLIREKGKSKIIRWRAPESDVRKKLESELAELEAQFSHGLRVRKSE